MIPTRSRPRAGAWSLLTLFWVPVLAVMAVFVVYYAFQASVLLGGALAAFAVGVVLIWWWAKTPGEASPRGPHR